MTQPVNMVQLLKVRQTHLSSLNCVQVYWSEQQLAISDIHVLVLSHILPEIPHCVARPAGTEE